MKNRKHARRVKRLSLIVTLCAIILVVSTYAWFIGMKTVNVSSFDVKIASIDSLSLSLDGKNWSDVVEINKNNFYNIIKYEIIIKYYFAKCKKCTILRKYCQG